MAVNPLYNANHPIWKLLRTAIIGGLLTAFLCFNYNKMDERDITTILGIAGALLGFDFGKDKLIKSKKTEDDVPEVES